MKITLTDDDDTPQYVRPLTLCKPEPFSLEAIEILLAEVRARLLAVAGDYYEVTEVQITRDKPETVALLIQWGP